MSPSVVKLIEDCNIAAAAAAAATAGAAAAAAAAAAANAAAAAGAAGKAITKLLVLQGRLGWAEVWEYALQQVQITPVLRMLLDDPQTSVVTAAAQALAVLVGPGWEEEEAWQAADDNPTTGRLVSKRKKNQVNCGRRVELSQAGRAMPATGIWIDRT